MVAFALKEK